MLLVQVVTVSSCLSFEPLSALILILRSSTDFSKGEKHSPLHKTKHTEMARLHSILAPSAISYLEPCIDDLCNQFGSSNCRYSIYLPKCQMCSCICLGPPFQKMKHHFLHHGSQP